MKTLALFLLALLYTFVARATTAADLVANCEKSNTATKSKGAYDQKHPDDIYQAGQCSGFIQGWLEGIDGAILNDGPSKLAL
jgi:hypothetical protein